MQSAKGKRDDPAPPGTWEDPSPRRQGRLGGGVDAYGVARHQLVLCSLSPDQLISRCWRASPQLGCSGHLVATSPVQRRSSQTPHILLLATPLHGLRRELRSAGGLRHVHSMGARPRAARCSRRFRQRNTGSPTPEMCRGTWRWGRARLAGGLVRHSVFSGRRGGRLPPEAQRATHDVDANLGASGAGRVEGGRRVGSWGPGERVDRHKIASEQHTPIP